MLILSNEDIEKILPVGTCIEVLEEAYRDLRNGKGWYLQSSAEISLNMD